MLANSFRNGTTRATCIYRAERHQSRQRTQDELTGTKLMALHIPALLPFPEMTDGTLAAYT